MASRLIAPMKQLTAPRLSKTLWANAGFSGVSGLALLAGAGRLSGWLGVTPIILAVAGAGIGLFAAYVGWVARQEQLPATHVRTIALADYGWVIAAAVVILLPGTMSGPGKAALAVVSLIVLDFAILEWMGLRRFRRRSGQTARVDD